MSESEANEMLVDRERLEYDDEDGSSVASDIQRDQLKEFATALRLKVDEIDVALARIDDGSYGRCDECFEPISQPRLARAVAGLHLRVVPRQRLTLRLNLAVIVGGPRGDGDRRGDQSTGPVTTSGAPRVHVVGAVWLRLQLQLGRLVLDQPVRDRS